VILAFAIVCVGIWTVVVASRGKTAAAAMVVAAGFIFGPIFPTIMAVLLGHFDKALHGRAVDCSLPSAAGLDRIPMLIGAYAHGRACSAAS